MVAFSKTVGGFKDALRLHRLAKSIDRDLDGTDHDLFNSLINEFHSIAIMAATTTSIISAHSLGLHVNWHGSINSYLPAEPLIFPAVAANLCPRSIDPDLIFGLQEFYIRTKFASNVTAHWQLEAEPDVFSSKADSDLHKDLWVRVCTLGIVIHCHLDGLDLKHHILHARLGKLREILRLARDGNHPCVANDGTVVVPGWIDRRSSPRVGINQSIWVEAAGVRQRSILQDVSASGLGVASCRAINAGMPIAVELESGRRLNGIAIWTKNDDRVGVRLLLPLSPTDPLLNPLLHRKSIT